MIILFVFHQSLVRPLRLKIDYPSTLSHNIDCDWNGESVQKDIDTDFYYITVEYFLVGPFHFATLEKIVNIGGTEWYWNSFCTLVGATGLV